MNTLFYDPQLYYFNRKSNLEKSNNHTSGLMNDRPKIPDLIISFKEPVETIREDY